ncbi:hypothetical protein [Rhodopirellula islandica]|nr:hypothetical protein [Rhodopirellula islandica]
MNELANLLIDPANIFAKVIQRANDAFGNGLGISLLLTVLF